MTFICGIENWPPVETVTPAHGCVDGPCAPFVMRATMFDALVGSATTVASVTPSNGESVGAVVSSKLTTTFPEPPPVVSYG